MKAISLVAALTIGCSVTMLARIGETEKEIEARYAELRARLHPNKRRD
jgi:hypothetical protein